jgi:hypothetical protein
VAVREGLRPFLEGTPRAPVAETSSPGVALVCPAFAAFPEAPASQLARRLAEQLPGARVLTLDPHPRPVELTPRLSRLGGVEVRAFTPDEPLPRDASRELPASSSLQSALRGERAPTVFLPADSLLARESLPHLHGRTWGIDPNRPEPALSALLQSLLPSGATHAT